MSYIQVRYGKWIGYFLIISVVMNIVGALWFAPYMVRIVDFFNLTYPCLQGDCEKVNMKYANGRHLLFVGDRDSRLDVCLKTEYLDDDFLFCALCSRKEGTIYPMSFFLFAKHVFVSWKTKVDFTCYDIMLQYNDIPLVTDRDGDGKFDTNYGRHLDRNEILCLMRDIDQRADDVRTLKSRVESDNPSH